MLATLLTQQIYIHQKASYIQLCDMKLIRKVYIIFKMKWLPVFYWPTIVEYIKHIKVLKASVHIPFKLLYLDEKKYISWIFSSILFFSLGSKSLGWLFWHVVNANVYDASNALNICRNTVDISITISVSKWITQGNKKETCNTEGDLKM